MSEQASSIPAVEVRGTFRPSDGLRRWFTEYVADSGLDLNSPESFTATLLFASWRRRVMSRQTYYGRGGERESHGYVWKADQSLDQIKSANLQLDGRIGSSTRKSFTRISLYLAENPMVDAAGDYLDSIPTIEAPLDPKEIGPNLIYTDIYNTDLRPRKDLFEGLQRLHLRSVHPATSKTLYVSPGLVVVRDCLLPIEEPSSEQG